MLNRNKSVKKKEIVKPDINIEVLKTMQKLEVKDGDVVVLRHPFQLSPEAHEFLRSTMKDILHDFGIDVHVMVLEEAMDIGILRRGK